MRGELQAHLNKAAVKLSSEIDTDNGLLVLLLASDVLTDQQVETCKAKGTRAQKVDAILDSLKRQPDDCYSKFSEALKEIGRKDLCDYLKQLAENGDVQRLPIAEDKKMVKFEDAFAGKWDDLKAKLNLGSGLVTKLRDFKLLTRDEVDDINNPMKTNAQKVECLLDKLERREASDFPLFVTALKTSNQPHILNLLNI